MKSDGGYVTGVQGSTGSPDYKRWFEEERTKVLLYERVFELLVVAKLVTREKLDAAKKIMA